MRKLQLLFILPILFVSLCRGQDKPIVVKGALIYTVTGASIPNGVLVVQHGKIQSIGDASTHVPDAATVIDASGKTIIPGIVDTHSHIGASGGGDNSNALNPEVRVFDGIDPESTEFKKALAGGITTANVM